MASKRERTNQRASSSLRNTYGLFSSSIVTSAIRRRRRNDNRSVATKIRETELAQLLLFHPGAPVHTMVVAERPKPANPFVFLRGNPASRGDDVSRRFLSVLDTSKTPFSGDNSGRLELAERIVDPQNPLTRASSSIESGARSSDRTSSQRLRISGCKAHRQATRSYSTGWRRTLSSTIGR